MMILRRIADLNHHPFNRTFAYCRGKKPDHMSQAEIRAGNCRFSSESIQEQIQKLLADPLFSLADILKRFLLFIVKETLEGRSDQLKEYTVGVKVLHKPVSFNPQVDAIVRIHACRLRRTLNRYYEGRGKEDSIRIEVPKGNYIPIFYESLPVVNGAEKKTKGLKEKKEPAGWLSPTLVAAVMPFSYFGNRDTIASLAEGLASQLSTGLAGLNNISVIAYNPLRFLNERPVFLREIILKAGAQYLFTGDVQMQNNRVRINIQMINALTYEQMWSQLYERKLTATNMFDIQDEIVKLAIVQVEHFRSPKKPRLSKSSAMAVA
jgi:TolB-like protein